MTYREFIKAIREQADFLENAVKTSQVITINSEVAEDDTILFAYQGLVEELVDNVTGVYGHTVAGRI